MSIQFRDPLARERAHTRFFRRRQADVPRGMLTRSDWPTPNDLRWANWRLVRVRHEIRERLQSRVIRY